MNSKKAFVTGASEGIGRCFAQRLVKEGYRVTALARNAERLDELQKELGTDHLVPLVADLSKQSDLNEVAKTVTEGKFQLLINNAGFGHYGIFPEVDLQIWKDMLHVNIEALVVL